MRITWDLFYFIRLWYELSIKSNYRVSSRDDSRRQKEKVLIKYFVPSYKSKPVLDLVQQMFTYVFNFTFFSPTEVRACTCELKIKHWQVLLCKLLRQHKNLWWYFFRDNFSEITTPVMKKSHLKNIQKNKSDSFVSAKDYYKILFQLIHWVF